MLRRFFRRRQKVVKVSDSNGHEQWLDHGDYVSKSLADRRAESELAQLGISGSRPPDYMLEYVMRRWMM